jgi:predicted transcriptional regulator
MSPMTSTHGNQKATDKEIINAVNAVEEPVASASEVSTALSMTRTGVTNRLKELQKEGRVAQKSVGNGYVWWVID